MFLKPKPNLPDIAKSRAEFYLQQIAECVGFDRFMLPVVSRKTLLGVYESERDPNRFIEFVGEHLAHDVRDVRFRIVEEQPANSCGSGCSGSCDGPSELPGRYDARERSITLGLEIDRDPTMGLAALVNGVVSDLLHQNQYDSAHLPERVDLAVIGMGLGMLRNQISLVKRQANNWDPTQWELIPRPFLDCESLAYVNAMVAWARRDAKPDWANDLPSDLKRPMRKSLKYLLKTSDSLFSPQVKRPVLAQSQQEWCELAASESASKQVIAIRHLAPDGIGDVQQGSLLLEKLRSANVAITLHAIAATERMMRQRPTVPREPLLGELRLLADHRDDQVRAKAMCALASLGQVDETTVETAALMLEENIRHVVFAGVYALSTLESLQDHILPPFDRCLVRALRTCDYELVDLCVTAYRHWLDDPQTHLQDLLRDSPEHLPIALEVLQKVPNQLVQLRRGA
ncbi:MAG: hypothetical protein AAGD07_05865 [Planctomycetota bacterium]